MCALGERVRERGREDIGGERESKSACKGDASKQQRVDEYTQPETGATTTERAPTFGVRKVMSHLWCNRMAQGSSSTTRGSPSHASPSCRVKSVGTKMFLSGRCRRVSGCCATAAQEESQGSGMGAEVNLVPYLGGGGGGGR